MLGEILSGISAITGIAGAIGGRRDAKKRQGAINGAYNRYNDEARTINTTLSDALQRAAAARDASRQGYADALNSAQRATSIGESQAKAKANLESVLQNFNRQEEGRTGAAKQAQGSANAETSQDAGLLANIMSAITQQSAGAQYAQEQLPVLEQLKIGRSAGNFQTIGNFDNLKNEADLNQTLAQIGSQPMQSNFTNAMNMLSPIAGAGAQIAMTYQPTQAASPYPNQPSVPSPFQYVPSTLGGWSTQP